MCALKNVKEVELIGMPKLKKCVLMGGLKNVKSVKMENAGKLESVKGLKEVVEEERKRKEEEERKRKVEEERKRKVEEERKRKEEEERKRREEAERKRREEEMRRREMEEKRRKEKEEKKKREEQRKRREEEESKRRELEERRKRDEKERKKREEEERIKGMIESFRVQKEIMKRLEEMNDMENSVIVKGIRDWNTANCNTGAIVIASNCCNDSELNMLDLSRFVNLRELKVGDECFENVKEVKLSGMKWLERVVIGKNSFTKNKNDWCWSINPNRHFYLKNCKRVRELKIGCYSFNDYSVCEIENVPSLEVIEMGELNERSGNFYQASLELKSDSQRMK